MPTTPINTDETRQNTNLVTATRQHLHHPSLLLDAACRVHVVDDENNTPSRRILLCGPQGSGKTSLAMNLAYSKAGSVASCLCFDARMCRCTAVTIYKAAATPTTGPMGVQDEEFPLFCRPVQEYDCTTTTTTTTTRDSITENEIDLPNPNDEDMDHQGEEDGNHTEQEVATTRKDWDPLILKRIRVHRVTSVRELLHDLLSMLGKPPREQPRPGGAIVIDDIDKIVARDTASRNHGTTWGAGVGSHQGNAQRTAMSAAILQIIAVATDTVMALESSQGVSPTGGGISVLVTTENTNTVASPCMDTIVTLRSQDQQEQQQNHGVTGAKDIHEHWEIFSKHSEKLSADCFWNAEICPSPWEAVSKSDNNIIMQYAVVTTSVDGNKEILWK
jgi:DNA polymerase III delta prime subunit